MSSARPWSAVIALLVGLLLLAAALGLREAPIHEVTVPTPAVPEAESTRTSPDPTDVTTAVDLQTAMSELCSTDTPGRSDGDSGRADTQEQITRFNNQKQGLAEQLSVSVSPEHLHLAALLETDPAIRFRLLDRAISAHSDDPFLLWGAMQLCSAADEPGACPLQDWEQRLIAVDGQNSESWVRIAANRTAQGNYDTALDAMRHASTAAETRVYWPETIEMIERGVAAASDFGFPERALLALNVATSNLPRYGDYTTMCRDHSKQSVDWAYACIAYGELVENQGKTEVGVAIARSIQQNALEALGESDKAFAVAERLEARRQERTNGANLYNQVTERLFLSNPAFFYSYLDTVKAIGEIDAEQSLAKEIDRLLEQHPELACEPN